MTKFVYVAASFAYTDRKKTEERKETIEKIVDRIKHMVGRSFVWYLPHHLKIENAWEMSLAEWSRKVYEHDMKALDAADIVLFISFGKENNAGAAYEVGYAVAKNKKVICIKMTQEAESLMITNSADAILKREDIDFYDWDTLPSMRCPLEKLS